jgi:hypothetical protein
VARPDEDDVDAASSLLRLEDRDLASSGVLGLRAAARRVVTFAPSPINGSSGAGKICLMSWSIIFVSCSGAYYLCCYHSFSLSCNM